MISYNFRSKATLNTNGNIYMISIHKHQVKDYVTKSQLQFIVGLLKFKHPTLHILSNIVYEISSNYKQLHLHMIIQHLGYLNYKKLSSINGFRIYYSPVYSLSNSLSYIYKTIYNRYKQEQIISENYYNHNYGFI